MLAAMFQNFTVETAIYLVLAILAIIAGGVVHEYGHAWAANRRGDTTARDLGRLTLWPAVHIDPVWTILIPAVLYLTTGFPFGGMKPVPVNPARLREWPRDWLFAVGCGPLFQVIFALSALVVTLLVTPFIAFNSYAMFFLYFCVMFNLLIAAFNMLPIPPLDGSRFMRQWLPARLREDYDRLGYGGGFLIIMVLMVTGVLGWVLQPVVHAANTLFFWCVNNLGLHNLTGHLL